jgi:chemotaxis protein methyltransferase CheR
MPQDPDAFQPAPPISAEECAALCDLLYRLTGIQLRSTKESLLRSRLRKRLAARGLDTWAEYHDYLQEHESEVPHFLDAMTTNETFFMREGDHWEFLRQHIIPAAAEQRRGPEREFSVWSAAASSGEELYSAALVLQESLPLSESWRLRLVGSDISGEVLERARAGIYGERALRALPDKLRERYFSPEATDRYKQRWRIAPLLRQSCRFVRHNLLEPFPEDDFDLVLCRNVFIYFDRRAKRRALDNLIPATRLGGYLVFSQTEAMILDSPLLERVRPSIYRRVG